MISLVIPSRNNLKYSKFAYSSIRKHLTKDVEVILLDDASTDDTWNWMKSIKESDSNVQIYRNEGPERVGHTVLYDVGANMAKNKIFGIFHADMIATPNYITNLVKHLKPKTVVSGTRIEPPLHPPGPEKFVKDFGLEPEVFNQSEFLKFVENQEILDKDKTSNGIFAPWIMYVKDFTAIGGHDKRVFAPMELEDSDLFNRFLLNGYSLLQSRDAFVYHMTCRGSRFKDGINIVQEIPVGPGQVWKRSEDSSEYTQLRQIKFREWWRKWHMDVLHNSNMLPIVHPRYNIGMVVKNCNVNLLSFLEPWCDTIYPEMNSSEIEVYIFQEQKISKFDIAQRVKSFTEEKMNDIVIEFDGKSFTNEHVNLLKHFPAIIKDSGEVGDMECDIFTFHIKTLNQLQEKLIHADNEWYIKQLK